MDRDGGGTEGYGDPDHDTVAEREKWEREGWPDRSPGSKRTPEGRRGCGFQLALLDSDAFEIVPGSAKQPAHLSTVWAVEQLTDNWRGQQATSAGAPRRSTSRCPITRAEAPGQSTA